MSIKRKKTLSQFTWTGTNQQGQHVQGNIEAKNVIAAKTQLRNKGILIKKIRQTSRFMQNLNKKPIKPDDIATFSRQLATMVSAGIPLVQGLEIVAKGVDNPTLGKLLTNIRATVESGTPFSEALSHHPKYFDPLFCNLIAAGEQSGTLDVMLDRIALYREKTQSLKKKIRKALTYPTAVVIIAFIVTTILLVKVIPQFESLFNNVGSKLPAFTRIVLHISEIFQAYWWMISLFFILLVLGMILGRKHIPKFRIKTDALFLKIPIFGNLIQKAAIARFCRTLATTFASGMPLINALHISSKATVNKVYENAILYAKDKVASGERFSQSLQTTKRFPSLIVQMVAIGEESGELDAMMNKAASIYEEDVDTAVASLSSLLEPMIMAFLGVIVGGLVIAMYLPIFKLGEAFK